MHKLQLFCINILLTKCSAYGMLNVGLNKNKKA